MPRPKINFRASSFKPKFSNIKPVAWGADTEDEIALTIHPLAEPFTVPIEDVKSFIIDGKEMIKEDE